MFFKAVDSFFTSNSEVYEDILDKGMVLTLGDGIVHACGLGQVTSGEMVGSGPYFILVLLVLFLWRVMLYIHIILCNNTFLPCSRWFVGLVLYVVVGLFMIEY